MKFIVILTCLALHIAHTLAQRCQGFVSFERTVCTGLRDDGNANSRNCLRSFNHNMWWYDSRSSVCKQMIYQGCGGNNNRFCSWHDCLRRCRR